MTPAALIAGIRAMDEEIARLRAQVAALTASTPSPAPAGLAAVAKAAAVLHADIERAAALGGNCPICATGLPCHARELGAVLHALESTPSPAPERVSGADPARGEGVSARACWDCAHDSEGNGRGMCLRQRGATFSGEVSAWIAGNYDREPKPWARNCPGWAPKSGEVSDG